MDVLVSSDGIPKQSYALKINGVDQVTDAFGFATVALPEGKHQLAIFDGQESKSVSFTIVGGERTQLLINLFQGAMLSDLNEPKLKEKAQKLSPEELGQVVLKLRSVNGEPVSGAKVYARGLSQRSSSNRKGEVVLSLPEGAHVLSVTHGKFSTQVVRNLQVKKGQSVTQLVDLTPTGLVLEDFVVLAPSLKGSIEALIEVRRKAADVADVMSAEQMAKTGDSDAAGSLKRVTGLTLKDGKYVYVRGMGERYSATLLNGVALPSPDPSRRVVPLDLFPVQFLDSMVIQKSYSPNQPAEFGGGVVQLQTKSIPEKFYFKANISQTVNTNDGPLETYAGGGSDWLGVDDGTRQAPSELRSNPNVLLSDNRYDVSDQTFAETLPELTVSTGNSVKMGRFRVGYNVSGLYKDNLNYRRDQRARYSGSTGVLLSEQELFRDITTKERTVGGIAGVGAEYGKNQNLNVNYINLRNTTDYVAQLIGDDDDGNFGRETQLEWAARTLKTFMVNGENTISAANDLKFEYHFAESKARRDEPFRTRYIYSPNDEGQYVFDPNFDESFRVRFYDLQEQAIDRGLSVASPFPWFGGRKGSARVGLSQTSKNRRSGMTRYSAEFTGESCGVLTGSMNTIFSQCADSFNMVSRTLPTDAYTANQNINAYFFRTRWPLLESLTLSTGMRFEESVQRVNTISPFEKDPIFTELTTRDWLPGSSLTWKMTDKMQVRLAYSETISRPDLREMSSTLWQDFETGYDVQGNPSLNATVIEAYDARWEWYFARRENVSFGVFYKDFDNPIERDFGAATDPRISFLNVAEAQVYGAEIEFSKRLSFISPWLRHWTLSGNYASIVSRVQFGELTALATTQTERALQGQSPYTANVLLDYENEPAKLNAGLAYNVYGRRIAFIAPDGLPNIFEEPVHQLDLVMRKKIGKDLVIGGKIRNLLNPEVKFTQAGNMWQSYRRGLGITLGVGMEI